MMTDLSNKNILITGGTGTFGEALLREILQQNIHPKHLFILSRDEYKQHQLKQSLPPHQQSLVTFLLGDVRDYNTLMIHFRQMDLVIHAAALKRIDSGEEQPDAFVETNTVGTTHVLNAALMQHVEQVVTISTDKAVYPTTLYGATKLCAERITIQKNKPAGLRASVIRLGNLLGSRGSIVTELIESNQTDIKLTHPDMTRFTMTTSESARYTLQVLGEARGGEIFVPKMPVYRLVDLVSVLLPDAALQYTQPRFTEKLHETLLSHEEARYTFERAQDYVICMKEDLQQWYQQQPTHAVPASFEYHSNQHNFLSRDELRLLINPFI
uniref:SDR family NAD(P)-dependent oxidoreductase n=1 Tax=Roseihalotalea indica TaxID=2867963 RepID=A0AA49JD43_9BACT|nr:SDR family NAD(P)-dependent oxidoreductase [Tunicatimonas sp. TK19036]